MFFKKKFISPNFDERTGGQAPSVIVLHYTGMPSAKGALERLCAPESKVSAHMVIEENGKVHALVPEDRRAWHAGKSYWAGEVDINSASIGIELVNPGHEFGYRTFPERQIAALEKLCARLMKKYTILPSRVLAHSDVAPSRKVDPGHLFPWERLAAGGIGLWPHVEEMDLSAAVDLVGSPDSFHALLCGYGYNPEDPPEVVIEAFHRHFCPDKFRQWDDRPVTPDVLSCARLLALLRLKNEQEEKPPF